MKYEHESLTKRQFVNLWLAQGISQFGDALLEITLPVWVGLVTKSPVQVAGVAAAELIPAILVGPVTGVIAERLNPKTIMILADLFRAVFVLLLVEFHGTQTAYVAYIVSFSLSLGARIFVPAQSVLVRRMTPDENIQRAQGKLHVASSISLALGPALGGTLLLVIGPTAAVILDSVTFVVSATFLFNIRHESFNWPPLKDLRVQSRVNTVTHNFVQGLRFLIRSRMLVIVAMVTACCSFVGFVWFTVDVFYVKNYLDLPGETVGYLWAASGFGDLLAGLILGRLANRMNSYYSILAGLCIRATALLSYCLIGRFSYDLPICLFAGFGDGMTAIATSTLAMQHSPVTMMGRVSSAMDSVGQLSGIGATLVIAVLGSGFTARQDLVACAVLLSCTALCSLYGTRYLTGSCSSVH